MIDKRISWDEFFIKQCDLISSRSTCDRKNVGAVIVKDKRMLCSGYNGSLPGLPHCSDPDIFYECHKCGKKYSTDEVRFTNDALDNKIALACGDRYGCIDCYGDPLIEKHGGHDLRDNSCVRTVHAEINAIAQAARMGISVEGATMYTNTFPCLKCFQTIVSSGIVKLVYSGGYREDDKEYMDREVNRVLKIVDELKNFELIKFKK